MKENKGILIILASIISVVLCCLGIVYYVYFRDVGNEQHLDMWLYNIDKKNNTVELTMYIGNESDVHVYGTYKKDG